MITDEQAMELWRNSCGAYEDAEEAGDTLRAQVIAGDEAAATYLKSRINEMLAEKDAEIEKLDAEIRKLKIGNWFYLAGDMSSDCCRFSPSEVIDDDWLNDNRGEGNRIIQIEVAKTLPDIWAAVHFFSEEEKDARDSDDEYEFTEHATEEEARAALKETQP